jgi:hypothetical protein
MKQYLNDEQKKLREIIEENLKIAKDWQNQSKEAVEIAFKKMSAAAHELHMQLNPKPKHHRYMIENRGMDPEDPEFYNHIHPVEDLLAYLDDTSANDDPIDQTLGDKFTLRIYTNRWGHYDVYHLTRTEKGWYSEFHTYSGEDDINKSGMKNLIAIMKHDSVSFPRDVDYYFSSIWQRAKDEGLSHEQVQEMLDRVAEWISETEKNAPIDLLI